MAKKYLRFRAREAGYTLLVGLKITPLDSFGLLGVCLITVTGISIESVVDRVAKCVLQLPSMGLYVLFWSSALLGRIISISYNMSNVGWIGYKIKDT